MVIRGRNLYPQDIEATVGKNRRDPHRRSCVVFSVSAEGEELVVVVKEVSQPFEAPEKEIG
jgi:hypothetical protein